MFELGQHCAGLSSVGSFGILNDGILINRMGTESHIRISNSKTQPKAQLHLQHYYCSIVII